MYNAIADEEKNYIVTRSATDGVSNLRCGLISFLSSFTASVGCTSTHCGTYSSAFYLNLFSDNAPILPLSHSDTSSSPAVFILVTRWLPRVTRKDEPYPLRREIITYPRVCFCVPLAFYKNVRQERLYSSLTLPIYIILEINNTEEVYLENNQHWGFENNIIVEE